MSPVTPLDPTDPPRLGEYELVGRLGAGGMGTVYLGRGPGGQMAAVKLIRADLAHDGTFRERFRREVEALRRVSGPRVARLLGADTEAPQPYLVVEYVDGPTLTDAVASGGPLDGPRLRALAAALAEALVIIHEAGVIHRDLKPSNVILAADQPKLVDFGVAAASGAIPLTMAGTVIGSAGWMAPEQAAGAVSTPAVDVFTWASLIAFAGTGRFPFGVGSAEEVTARILHGEPDLQGLPQEVRPFVEAAFIKDPTQRPSAKAVLAGLVGREEATTPELVDETTSLIENTWVAAPPTPAAPPVPPRRRRWPIVAAIAAAVVLVLIGAGVALLIAGDDDDTAEGGGGPATTDPPPATATTAAPTTTTEPRFDLTVEITVGRSLIEEVFSGGAGCPDDPLTDLSIQSEDGEILAERPVVGGEPTPGGLADDCLYTEEFPGLPGLDRYIVEMTDSEFGDLIGRVGFSREELEATGGVAEVGQF